MSERIMSAERGRLAWKRPNPPARLLRIDQETGCPLSWIITRTETFSSDKPAEQVLSLDCGHQIKTKAGRSQEVPQMVVCRECHKNRPKLAQVLGKPRPHQLYLRDELITDWKGAEEGCRFAIIGGSPSERTLALIWAMATAIECGARTIAAVHWRPKFLQMKMSGLYRCLSGAYGEPVACRWNTKEATIMMARPGDLSLVGTEFDFAVIDDANESEGEGEEKDFLSSVISRCRPGPSRVVISPRAGSRFSSQWSLISVD